MNFNSYQPKQDRMIVYECIGNPVKEIPGIISAYFLALISNYKFRINGLDKSYFADLYTSDIDWWSTDWKDFGWKHGLWSLIDITDEEKKNLSTENFSDKYYNTHILHFYVEENVIPHILNNPNYQERIKELGVNENPNFIQEIFVKLFTKFENEFLENVNTLIDSVKKHKNKLFVRIDKNSTLDSIQNIEEHDFIYVSCNDYDHYLKLKKQYPQYNLSHIKSKYPDTSQYDRINKIGMLIEVFFMKSFEKSISLCNDDFSKCIELFHSKTK
jgi:hypothetical protein